MTTSYNNLYTLPEISFIGGTDKILTFTAYQENETTLLDISSGSIEWLLSHYDMSDDIVLSKTGLLTSANTFTVTLDYDDTVSLSGRFTQQVIVTDFSGNVFRVAQGTIIIMPVISIENKWWLSGYANNCLAAYQPKGAESLIDSYTNLMNSDIYNCIPFTAPTWDFIDGWIFNGAQSLDTAILGGNNYSAIVRFSDRNSYTPIFGELKTGKTRLNIYPRYSDNRSYFRSGGTYDSGTPYDYGILAVTPTMAYANGLPIGALTTAFTEETSGNIYIGAMCYENNPNSFFIGKIQAYAIYNSTLTDAQVLAITNAMSVL